MEMIFVNIIADKILQGYGPRYGDRIGDHQIPDFLRMEKIPRENLSVGTLRRRADKQTDQKPPQPPDEISLNDIKNAHDDQHQAEA